MSTGRFTVSENAGKYFDWEKIALNPDSTYLSEEGMLKVIEWGRILENNDYGLAGAEAIDAAATFLKVVGASDADRLTTKIMLAILADAQDSVDER